MILKLKIVSQLVLLKVVEHIFLTQGILQIILNYAENVITLVFQTNVELLEIINVIYVMLQNSDNLILVLPLLLTNVYVCTVILMLEHNIVHPAHIIFQDVSNVLQQQVVRYVILIGF